MSEILNQTSARVSSPGMAGGLVDLKEVLLKGVLIQFAGLFKTQILTGHHNHSICWCQNCGIKNLPNHWSLTCCCQFCGKIGYHSNNMTLLNAYLKLALSTYHWLKMSSVTAILLLLSCDEHDKMQLQSIAVGKVLETV